MIGNIKTFIKRNFSVKLIWPTLFRRNWFSLSSFSTFSFSNLLEFSASSKSRTWMRRESTNPEHCLQGTGTPPLPLSKLKFNSTSLSTTMGLGPSPLLSINGCPALANCAFIEILSCVYNAQYNHNTTYVFIGKASFNQVPPLMLSRWASNSFFADFNEVTSAFNLMILLCITLRSGGFE